MRVGVMRRLALHLLGLIVLLTACSSGLTYTPTRPEPSPLPTRSTTAPTILIAAKAHPISLAIPAIQLRAVVEPVGIQATGDLATPAANPWEDAGWYTGGPYPGERGSAISDGHLDRPGGLPAVFWRLHALHVGDDVQVMNATGKTLHFRVIRIAFYAPQNAPLQEIFGNRGGIYLNLITCAGAWDSSSHQTTLR